MKRIALLASPVGCALVLAGVTACGSPHPPHHHAALQDALTNSQGAAICNDLSAWLLQATNETQPRFTARMQADEQEAGSTNLGLDLQTMDTNLQELNGAALMPSPPGYSPPTGTAGLHNDCASYGVNIVQPGSQPG